MHSKTVQQFTGSLFSAILILAGAQLLGTVPVSAQTPPAPQPAAPPLLDSLTWDAVMKEATPQPGQPTADFVFGVTNPSESNVVIERVQTSCGCTVAKLPSTPWVLTPHTNGQISVTVNLAGKSGTIFKTITVFSTNAQKVLTVKVNMPENPAVMRSRNQQIAMADAQAVFKGDCAKCHADTSKDKFGKQLYVEACGICHEAKPRATMVPDLHVLPHPTDYAFWKQIITDGKPKTLMPAFGGAHGGPLTEKQIESLANVLNQAFPSGVLPAPSVSPAPIKTSGVEPVQTAGSAQGLVQPPQAQIK